MGCGGFSAITGQLIAHALDPWGKICITRDVAAWANDATSCHGIRSRQGQLGR